MQEIPHRKQIFITLFIAIFVAMMGVGIIAPTMPLYAKTLGATGFALGMIYATFSISRAIFMPLAGRLSDIKGRKIFIVMGLIVYTLTSLGYIWSSTVVQLIWLRFLHGIGSAMVIPIAIAVIGDISPKGKEGATMGNFLIALFLGFGTGPLLGGIVQDTVGMNAVFYCMGGFSLIALFLILFLLPGDNHWRRKKRHQVSSFKKLWSQNLFKGIWFFRFSNASGRAALLTFLPVFATKVNIGPSHIGILVSINIFLTSFLQHFFGKLADRRSKSMLVVTGNTISACTLFLIPLADSFTQLALLGILMGIGGGIAYPASGAIATQLGRHHGMGNVMGYFNMAMSFGGILGAMVAGVVMDMFTLSTVFIYAGIIGMLGSLVCGFWFYRANIT